MNRHASLNRSYRLIWNHSLNAWVPAPEIARCRSKSGRSSLVGGVLSLAALLAPAAAWGGPTGGQIVDGAGSIVQSGTVTTIEQTSATLGATWDSFDIEANERVQFVQPGADSLAVNRILDSNGSRILGQLDANGQVWLINSNGVYFGAGATVDVGGLVASTLDLQGEAGASTRFSGTGTGGIVNDGALRTATGGYVALIGNTVINNGSIEAPLGTVAMGAGSTVDLSFDGSRLVNLAVADSTLDNLAENGGLIRADGGHVIMNAGARDSLLASVVNNTGVIEAQGVEERAGTILLLGGMSAGTVQVGGTLDVSAPQHGDGGFIETSAAHVQIADGVRVTALSDTGSTGEWLIDPNDFRIAATGGDISGSTLSGILGSVSVTIQSVAGGTDGFGDVIVDDSVSWSRNTLTLNAERNIVVNTAMNASGTAGLALEYGQAAVAAGNTAEYVLNAPINLASTGSFSTRLGSDGTTHQYTILTSLGSEGSTTGTDLQGMNGNTAGNYVLGADIDASSTASWNSGAGFAPIGSANPFFTGRLDGLGHAIDGLTINGGGDAAAGLFSIATGATIQNLSLTNVDVSGGGEVGAIAGNLNNSQLSHVQVSGQVSGEGIFVSVGGVAGFAFRNVMSDVHFDGDVNVVMNGAFSSGGGLIGGFYAGTIEDSSSSGTVTATGSRDQAGVGGLVGFIRDGGSGDEAAIVDSHSSSAVSTQGPFAGGLVGYVGNPDESLDVLIDQSSASGSVSIQVTDPTRPQYAAGGLVGATSHVLISNSSASGDVSVAFAEGITSSNANIHAGGLVGLNADRIVNSHATGSVSLVYPDLNGRSNPNVRLDVGGLVGSNSTCQTLTNFACNLNNVGAITSSHATGDVNLSIGALGQNSNSPSLSALTAGGLVGYNNGTVALGTAVIDGSHASGDVDIVIRGEIFPIATYLIVAGGLVGDNAGQGQIVGSYARGRADITEQQPLNEASFLSTYIPRLAGGLVGSNTGTVTNSHYDIQISGGRVTRYGLYRTQFDDWMANGTLDIGDYFTALGNDTYGISDYQGMQNLLGFAENADLTFVLQDSFSLQARYQIPYLAADFNGQFHTLSGLSLNEHLSGVGFISRLAGATVSNLTLDGASVIGRSLVGILAGRIDGGTITNVHTQGVVSTTTNFAGDPADSTLPRNGSLAGGLAGAVVGSSIVDSSFRGDVSGGLRVGGLVGFATAGSSIEGSSAQGGSVSNSLSGTSNEMSGLVGNLLNSSLTNSFSTLDVFSTGTSGGLVGSANNSSISNAFASGNIVGDFQVGGLVGTSVNSILDNVYATGDVTNLSSGSVGGLIGFVVNGGRVDHAYASGAVSGTTFIGGLIGNLQNTAVTVFTNSFWNTDTSGTLVAIGSSGGSTVTGLTNAQMMTQASFTGFDFSSASPVWTIYEGRTAPLLRSFLTPVTLTSAFNGTTAQTLNSIGDYTTNLGDSFDASHLFGSATGLKISSTSRAGREVATLLGADFWSDQLGYLITVQNRIINGTGSAAGDLAIIHDLSWTSGTLSLVAAGGIQFMADLSGERLRATARGGDITQIAGASLSLSVLTSLTAANGLGTRYDIDLGGAGNDFNIVDATGQDIELRDDAGRVFLRSINASRDLAVTASAGNILSSSISVIEASNGITTLTAGGGPGPGHSIFLGAGSSDFGVVNATGRNVVITDRNALTAVIDNATANVSLTAGGALAVSGTVRNLSTTTTGDASSTTTFGNTVVRQNLAITSAGAVGRDGEATVQVNGSTTINGAPGVVP